jgi:quinol monooxygenase YgiN
MLASVGVTKSRTPRTDDEQSSLDQALMPLYSRVRKGDGCEGILILRDQATGDAFTIYMWRDQAAMDKGIKALSEDSAQMETAQRALQELKIEVVGETRTYEVTMNI